MLKLLPSKLKPLLGHVTRKRGEVRRVLLLIECVNKADLSV